MNWPTIVYNEEVMREGFGIEDVGIPLDAKIALLDALSQRSEEHTSELQSR